MVSDHFDRTQLENDSHMNRVSLIDGTFLAFVDPRRVNVTEYKQAGTIKGSVEKFDYVNQYNFGYDDSFCIYFLVLPKEYYPKKFIVPNEPHFATRIGERIRITWWFREQCQVKLEIERNIKKFESFDYIDSPTFLEKHPNVINAYNEAKNLVTQVVGNALLD